MEVFCFFMGVLYAYTGSIYLPLALCCLFYLTPRYLVPGFFIAGALFAWGHDWWIAPQGMPEETVLSNALLQGTIDSLPLSNSNKTQFIFAVHQLNGQPVQALVQLAWYNRRPSVHAGEEWQLQVKIKKPRNFLNPGSYDYVRSLQTKHIYWTGYIRQGNNHRLKPPRPNNWLAFRERLNKGLTRLAPNQRIAGIIEALTFNNTNHISQDDWSLFRRTGTTHLFGISGEHIALLSGLFFFIFRKLWSLSAYCCLRIPAHSIARAVGLIVALFYALLAGFAPPVQRALIGCFFYTLSYLGSQRFTPWQVWRYALLGVLLIEPHAVFMQGFYFSFLAVVCLLLTHQRWQLKGYKGNLALQLSCLIGLMPLSLYWFSYGSINGYIANLFAIPLVGFLIVPLSLCLLCLNSFNCSWLIMSALTWLINLLFTGLSWMEHLAAININWSLNSIELMLPLLGALLLGLLVPIKPFKTIAILWLVLPFFPPKNEIKVGEALVRILDVGQGLSVHIQTQKHNLLYDTGDQFFQGSDLGQMVVLPFYQALGIKKIDAIVISHPDKDHLGGLKSIEAALPVQQLIVNDPDFYHRGLNCHDYPAWEWDKVHFRFIPIHASFKDKNNNSCTLQISTKGGRVLLAGDIEKSAEDYLVRTFGSQLKSEIVVLPHHGSKTSSSYRFLLEIAPQYALASLGFDNRFHFPHAKTLNTLRTLNIPFYRTDECGMIELKLPATGSLKRPQCFNQAAAPILQTN
jgi:competence protein ComEC